MAMSETEMALMIGANQLAAMRPVNPGAFSGVPAGMQAPPPQEGAPIPMDQAGMMQYLQEKANQIRQRMGADAMNNGALDAVLSAMPTQGNPPGGV